ncbi:hypothetical protein [Amycolatopsis sp. NBC_01480]|uniref:hypothetical protein n=1 Tax=Amycolatopsis sp. NBC_01480 TaxID=2903562 RepID=UPI002E2C5688|nr:hypothetical protein [Amycolatopsis sp. NBC_01480]
MPRRQSSRRAAACTTFKGRDCAPEFAVAAGRLAGPVQAKVQVWGADLGQPLGVDHESDDADIYLEAFYERSDGEAHNTAGQPG